MLFGHRIVATLYACVQSTSSPLFSTHESKFSFQGRELNKKIFTVYTLLFSDRP